MELKGAMGHARAISWPEVDAEAGSQQFSNEWLASLLPSREQRGSYAP